jgi:hypothetical protein
MSKSAWLPWYLYSLTFWMTVGFNYPSIKLFFMGL